MIIEILGIFVPGPKVHELGKALVSLVGPIQVQPGCLSCRLFQGWPNPDELHMEARWDNQENLMHHLQSDLYKRLLLLMELSVAPPVLEFLTVTQFRGLDLVEEARPVGPMERGF